MSFLVFDADDTLWENNVRFNRVFDDYLAWLAHPTLDAAAIRSIVLDVEKANVVAYGYGSKVFLRCLHEVFEKLSERPATDAERAEIGALATALTDHQVELIPEVAETLDDLAARHELILLTKGEPAEQQGKIDASGLGRHFTSTNIVPDKTVAVYVALAEKLSLDPATTWMIGNSPRSDILPARQAGWRAVFLPNPNTWELELGDLDADDPGILTLSSFADLRAHF